MPGQQPDGRTNYMTSTVTVVHGTSVVRWRRPGVASAVLVAAIVLLGGAAYALSITLTPAGGPAHSSFTAEVPCDEEPTVYLVDLDAGAPPATLVPAEGVESEPGVWSYNLDSAERDQQISAGCGDAQDRTRYDVDRPALMPGPTVADYGSYRPELDGTSVVGTDCPAGSQAKVTFTAPGTEPVSATAAIDQYGDWEASVPASIPTGDVTAAATCGDVAYEPITFARPGGIPATTIPRPPTTPVAPAPVPAPATPVAGTADYTG